MIEEGYPEIGLLKNSSITHKILLKNVKDT